MSPAWYGKLACLGDFAARRLAQPQVGVLDRWLAEGVAASRAALGEHWQGVYLTAPVWRFGWAPGLLDDAWWFGVMMPSVDNVGRYFPLVVLQAVPGPPAEPVALLRLERWFAAVAEAALATLQPGASVERFEAALGAVAPLPASPAAAPRAAVAHADRVRHEVPPGEELADCLEALAVAETVQRLRGCSVWWSERSLSTAVGLPTATSFTRLLDGSW